MDEETLKEEFQFSKAVFKKWPSQNAELGKQLCSPDIDSDAPVQLIERGKLIYKLYEICSR